MKVPSHLVQWKHVKSVSGDCDCTIVGDYSYHIIESEAIVQAHNPPYKALNIRNYEFLEFGKAIWLYILFAT